MDGRDKSWKQKPKGIPKLDLTLPSRMRFGVFQNVWGGSKGDPSEDVDVVPEESQLFILAFHETSLGAHHTQLNVAPLRRGESKSIAVLRDASNHSVPWLEGPPTGG